MFADPIGAHSAPRLIGKAHLVGRSMDIPCAVRNEGRQMRNMFREQRGPFWSGISEREEVLDKRKLTKCDPRRDAFYIVTLRLLKRVAISCSS